jgi:hypothetical protein
MCVCVCVCARARAVCLMTLSMYLDYVSSERMDDQWELSDRNVIEGLRKAAENLRLASVAV